MYPASWRPRTDLSSKLQTRAQCYSGNTMRDDGTCLPSRVSSPSPLQLLRCACSAPFCLLRVTSRELAWWLPNLRVGTCLLSCSDVCAVRRFLSSEWPMVTRVGGVVRAAWWLPYLRVGTCLLPCSNVRAVRSFLSSEWPMESDVTAAVLLLRLPTEGQ